MPDERADPAQRRYLMAAASVVFLATAAMLVLSPLLADDPGLADDGTFDHAEWDEPGLAPAAHIPGLADSPGTLTAALDTPSGAVLVSVHPDGRVTLQPLDDGVSWFDAKAAFETWAASKGLAEPAYDGLELAADGRLIEP